MTEKDTVTVLHGERFIRNGFDLFDGTIERRRDKDGILGKRVTYVSQGFSIILSQSRTFLCKSLSGIVSPRSIIPG